MYSKRLMKTNKPINLPTTTAPPFIDLEQHYSVAQIAEAWCLSRATVRRHFGSLPGVIHFGRGETGAKRKYLILRIPARILRAEHQRMTRSAA